MPSRPARDGSRSARRVRSRGRVQRSPSRARLCGPRRRSVRRSRAFRTRTSGGKRSEADPTLGLPHRVAGAFASREMSRPTRTRSGGGGDWYTSSGPAAPGGVRHGTDGAGVKLAVELALALGGEVVNCDAMQVYRGLPIATAQISEEEQRGVPHHMLGVVDPTAGARANPRRRRRGRRGRHHRPRLPRRRAARRGGDTRAGKVPLLVGGSDYYLQALVSRSLLDETDHMDEVDEDEDEDDDDLVNPRSARGRPNASDAAPRVTNPPPPRHTPAPRRGPRVRGEDSPEQRPKSATIPVYTTRRGRLGVVSLVVEPPRRRPRRDGGDTRARDTARCSS